MFALAERGPVSMVCANPRSRGGSATIIQYDTATGFGAIRCSSYKRGFECTNAEGNGFFLSRARQLAFNDVTIASSSVVAGIDNSKSDPGLLDIQERLSALGYYRGELDGESGPLTREAIKAFQRGVGRRATGRLSNRDVAELKAATDFTPTAKAEGYEEELTRQRTRRKEIIASLNVLGFKVPDGPFNHDERAAAIAAFQSAYGLTPSDDLTDEQFSVLRALAQAKRASSGVQEPSAGDTTDSARSTGTDDPVAVASSQAEPVSVDLVANQSFETPFPDHQFATIRDHVVIYEQPYAAPVSMQAHFWAWVDWMRNQVPTAVPSMLEHSLAGNLVFAHSMLSDESKTSLQRDTGLSAPLFYDDRESVATAQRNLDAADYQKRLSIALRERNRGIAGSANQVIHKVLDEFTLPSFESALKGALEDTIAKSRSQLPLKTVQIYELYLGEYDFEKQGFGINTVLGAGGSPVTSPATTNIIKAIYESMPTIRPKVRVVSDVEEMPLLLPMAPTDAKAFVERLAEHRGDDHRSIFLAVFGGLTKMSGTVGAGSSSELLAHLEIDRFEFWLDAIGQTVVYSQPVQKVSAEQLATIETKAAGKPVTLFGQEYLVAALANDFPKITENSRFVDWLFERRVAIENAGAALHALPDGTLKEAIRPEIKSGERKPTSQDRQQFLSILNGQARAGVSGTVVFPTGISVRSANELYPSKPIEFIENVLAASTGDRAFSQYFRTNGAVTHGKDGDASISYQIGSLPTGAGDEFVEVYLSIAKKDIADIPPLTVAGNIVTEGHADAYQVAAPFPDHFPENMMHGHVVMELSTPREATDIKPRHSRTTKVVVFDAKPVKAVFLDQGRTIEIPLAGPTEVSSYAGIDVVPANTAPVTLNAEVTDLILVRELADGLGTDDYRRMLLARWHYEQKFQGVDQRPEGGRFFEFGQAKPSADLESLTARYREWVGKRSKTLPRRFVLDKMAFLLRSPGRYRIGQPGVDPGMVQNVVNSCGYRIQLAQGKVQTREHQLQMLTNACAYLDAAAKHMGGISHFGGPDLLEAKNRNSNHGAYEIRQRYSPAGTVGIRAACRTRSDWRDAYCEGMHDELVGDALSSGNHVLDDVFAFDSSVEISEATAAKMDKLLNRGSFYTRLIVEIESVEQLTSVPTPHFRQAVEDVDAFLLSQNLISERDRSEWSTSKYTTGPANLFRLNVISAEVYDSRTGEIHHTLDIQPHSARPDRALIEPVEPVSIAAPKEPYGPDIIGLQIGMTFDDADRIIREHMDVGTVLYANRDWSSSSAFGDLFPFSSGRLYESADGGERIVLFDEAPSATDVVISITRMSSLKKGAVKPASLYQSLVKKYGRADDQSNGAIRWGETDISCSLVNIPYSNRDIWRDANGKSTDWDMRKLGFYGIPVPDNDEKRSVEFGKDCSVGVMAMFDTRNNDEWDRLYQRIYDKSLYQTHFYQSEAMIKEGVGTAGDAPADDQSDVKL
ncbi:MAG: peptidoglycan-binding protein [Alphaproteobacteria bacterium]|nr:peptidoglycan-binding protein [Alphaproteobacteria bacterium]